jgi:hypothetical protein
VLPEHVQVMGSSADGFLWHGREIGWLVTPSERVDKKEPHD